MTGKQPVASGESNESNIFLIRGQRVMLSIQLAEAYAIGPEALVQSVERNIERFPKNSTFQLNPEEIADLESRHAISSQAAPYAFTAQGVIMLSSVLLEEQTNNDNQEACAPTCGCRK